MITLRIDPILIRIMIVSIGIAINAVSIIAGIGYIFGDYRLYSWGGELGMAVPTVVSLLLTGIAFIIIGGSWRHIYQQ